MKKKTILSVAFSLGALFITLQIFLWSNVSNENVNRKSKKNTFGKFITFTRKHNLPVFIIDEVVLSQLVNKSLSQHCKILCSGTGSHVALGLDSRFIEKKVDFLITATKEQLDSAIECNYGSLPSDLNLQQKPVPVHCYYRKDGFNIHLVIFYEIESHFWWHGSVSDSSKQQNIYDQHEGAFNRLTFKKVLIDGMQLRIVNNPTRFLSDLPQSIFIPCNHSRASAFNLKFGALELEDGYQYFTLKAVHLIRQAKEVLDQLEIPFWLSSGTCLGWYRQCSIIPYSKDVDLGIFIKDYKVTLIPSMQKAGLKLIHKFGKVSDSFELSFQGDKIKLDIFFFYKEKEYMWNGGTQTSSGNKYKYIFPTFTLCWTYFFEMKIRVPCQSEAYIEANYGKEWFQPVKIWDWKASPPNVRPNGVWPKEEWDEVINVYL